MYVYFFMDKYLGVVWYSKYIYNFLRKCQTILHGDFKILHLHWQDISVPAAALGVFWLFNLALKVGV